MLPAPHQVGGQFGKAFEFLGIGDFQAIEPAGAEGRSVDRAGLAFEGVVHRDDRLDEFALHREPEGVILADQGKTMYVTSEVANMVHIIDVEKGGSGPGIVAAIDKFLPTIDDNTRVIPGHGPVSGKKEVIAYRNMIATVGKRVEEMVKAGKTLKEVVAAQPTREFDADWGVRGRKPDAFTEIVYFSYTPYKK